MLDVTTSRESKKLVGWVLWHINPYRSFNAKYFFYTLYIYIYIYISSKLATIVEGDPKAPFLSRRVLLFSLDCATLPLIHTLYR